MNTEEYFRSLTSECEILKNRVRHFINDNHWPTDGEWKESVLRSMIRRSAPESVTIGRGFVVKHEQCSTQIDVLVYDNTMPILYRDGDLVFITPASCRAIIEVKSSVSKTKFDRAAEKLANNSEFIRSHGMGIPLFTGLFSYDLQGGMVQGFSESLRDIADGNYSRIVDHVCIGADNLIKFWVTEPGNDRNRNYNTWHSYELQRMAPGYFIYNLVANVCRDPSARREDAWFPQQSKEASLVDLLPFVYA